MLFNSIEFVILVLVTFFIYYVPIWKAFSQNVQMVTLIVSSLFFYGYYEPILILLLLFSVGINVVSSYLIIYGNGTNRRLHAIWGVVLNLSILLFFKYSGLLGSAFFDRGTEVVTFLTSIPLPIGISFFTFQGISLIVDTYRYRDVKEYQSLIPKWWVSHARNVLLFKAFFPQLVSGPIVKAYFFLPQIKRKLFSDINWEYCFRTLILGYFLKMVIADNLKDNTTLITYPYFEAESSLTLIVMLFGYSVQIYADFAGYSLIALGLAALFGYQFPINFNFPYISSSFSEFWNRWHISLSSFLREYLYIPLGGNRKGKFRTYFNLLITMVLGGLWHGAAWSYAIWGTFHGLMLVIERFVTTHVKVKQNAFVVTLKAVFVFVMVTLAWLLFELPEFTHVLAYMKAIAGNWHRPHNGLPIALVLIYSIPVIGYHFIYLIRQSEALRAHRLLFHCEPLFFGLMLFMIITNSGTSNSFIYFQF
jgi:alginate O-acetyltransferase complex protein AlgI